MLAYLMVIWYIFPVLICCTKNLATLPLSQSTFKNRRFESKCEKTRKYFLSCSKTPGACPTIVSQRCKNLQRHE
jgi:hypothetical protein